MMKHSILFLIFLLSLTTANADKIYYEDWSGIYYLKHVYEKGKIKHPNFRHFSGETAYIQISTWKGRLIFQARLKTMRPTRYGYFDSEIKFPNKKKQIFIDDKCKVEISLEKDILKVDMNSMIDCKTALNISGEYIRYLEKNN